MLDRGKEFMDELTVVSKFFKSSMKMVRKVVVPEWGLFEMSLKSKIT
jgi:hypothetical protein